MNSKQVKGQTWLTEEQEKDLFKEKLKDGYRCDARSKIIYHVKQYDRKSLKFTCKTKSPAVAYRFAPAKVKKLLMSPEDQIKTVRTLISDEINNYREARKLEFESGEIEPPTWTLITRNLPVIEEYFGKEFPDIFDDDDFKEKTLPEFDKWFRSTRKGHTAFNVYKYLNAFVRYLHDRGVIRKKPRIKDPRTKAEKTRNKKNKERIFTKDEVRSIISKADARDGLIIELGFEMGLRISDACKLKWSMVRLDKTDPYICHEGEDKADTFSKNPLPIRLSNKLQALKNISTSEHVFPQERNQQRPIATGQVHFKTIRDLAEVKHGTFHTLRHTRLTMDFGNPKIPDSHVMIMRRVSYKVAIENYIHPTQDQRQAMRELSEGL